ncbi:hypothetical protein [Streptomyces viridosporus]|uniref:hypothetical protein n=1 Tax=Streptomyces viridosporus TaxID=67581 RepID=UPI001319FFEF|nr:hypothetical protein [Streptomyces viridosporus]
MNGKTGDVSGLATIDGVQAAAQAVVDEHVAAQDPHGDRAHAEEALQAHVVASDPHGDRAAAEADATAKVTAHAQATDPHGDRAYADGKFFPKAGGTVTGPINGPGTFAVAADGGVTAPSLTLPAAATTLSKSLVITAPAGAVSYVVWRAPKACTVVGVRGYRVGGTGATINAQRNASDLLATNLSLSTASTWLSGPSVQNASFAAGDSLTVAIRSVTGAPTAVTIQVDFQGA